MQNNNIGNLFISIIPTCVSSLPFFYEPSTYLNWINIYIVVQELGEFFSYKLLDFTHYACAKHFEKFVFHIDWTICVAFSLK